MDLPEKIGVAFLGLLVLAILGLIVGATFIAHIGTINGGQHTGYITAVEQEGIIWKTWRAYVKTDTQSSQEDRYCIIDETLIPKLKEEAKIRKQITINYSAPFIIWNWECGHEGAIVKGIE